LPSGTVTFLFTDIDGSTRSLPGLADIGAPALVATMATQPRFTKGKPFRSFTGPYGVANEREAARAHLPAGFD
jgi:hypothetical protein